MTNSMRSLFAQELSKHGFSTFALLDKVRIDSGFWAKYQYLIRNVVIPYQWEALNDRVEGAEPSHAIKNFRIAAGLEQGEFKGFVFQDSEDRKSVV